VQKLELVKNTGENEKVIGPQKGTHAMHNHFKKKIARGQT
jgi:hypothetical protein